MRRFSEAWKRGDLTALDGLLSASYTHVDVTGLVQDRGEWLSLSPGRAGLFKRRLDVDDVQIRVVGETAIRTGRVNVRSPDQAGEPSIESVRFTDVWVRQDGAWRREICHAAFI